MGRSRSARIVAPWVAFAVDGQARAVASAAPWGFAWAASDEALGAHDLTATAADRAGNTATATLHVDLTVPTGLQGLERTLAG